MPRSAIIWTRSRELSLNVRYHLMHRMMISWSKCRPLKRSCAEVGSVISAVTAGSRAFQVCTRTLSNTPPAPPPVPVTGKEIASKQPAPPPPPPERRWGVWANGWGDWVTVDNSGVSRGYNFTIGGFIAGVDYRISENFVVGILGGYSHTWTNLQPSGNIDVNSG